MFYIRTNNSSKKKLKQNLTLKEGLFLLNDYEQDVSLMYKLNNRGIKIITNKEMSPYSLIMEKYPSKNSKNILFQNEDILSIYSRLDEIGLSSGFTGDLIISCNNSEMSRISGQSNLNNVIKNISIPLKEILKENSNNTISESRKEITEITDENMDIDTNIILDEVCVDISDNHILDESSKSENYQNNKTSSNSKFIKYYTAGTLKSGSRVRLSEYIYNYKEALVAYELAKEKYMGDFNEISLMGYREDGSLDTRFTKKFEPNILSFEYISEFLKDFSKRAEFLSIVEEDVKNVMATEDKKYNVGYHILCATDLDFENENIKKLLFDLKLSADKRRDMKNLFKLLSVVKPLIDVSPELYDSIESTIENINKSSFSGMNLYKNMSINDFVKEVDVEYDNISKSNNPKDRARFCAIENTVSIYKKHYQS